MSNKAIISGRFTRIISEVDRLRGLLCSLVITDQERYPENYEAASVDATLRAEQIACELRHLVYASTTLRKDDYLSLAAETLGIEISQENGVLSIRLPALLPKRKQKKSGEYLLDPMTEALDRYFKGHPAIRFEHCVVCFTHIYDRELPDRRVRDYDNLELKQFLDVVTAFILTDDGGLLCDAYNTTELGDGDCTMLYVMDSQRFPQWLSERQNRVKSISDF